MPKKHRLSGTVLVLVGAALAILVCVYVYQHFRHRSQAELQKQNYRVLSAEESYLEDVTKQLGASATIASDSHFTLFLSRKTINDILSGLSGTTGPIPGIANSEFKVDSVASDFLDEFPKVTLTVDTNKTDLGLSIRSKIVAVLIPASADRTPARLRLEVRPIGIEPQIDWNHIHGKVSGFARDLIQIKAAELAKSIPPIFVPLSSTFSINLPASEQLVRIPVPAGTVVGLISVPPINAAKSLRIDRLLFLADGLHVFLSLNNAGTGPYPTPSLPIENSTPITALARSSSAKADHISKLKRDIESKTSAIRVFEDDLQVAISKNLVNEIATAFNQLPAASRHLHYHTQSEEGQILSTGGGPPFACGFHAEVEGGNSASGDLDLSNFQTFWASVGALDLTMAYSATYTAQIHGTGKPPAGPCSLLKPLPDCKCGVGGGWGTSVGISGRNDGALNARLSLRGDAVNWLIYDLALTGPPSIDVNVKVDLGKIGKYDIHASVQLPLKTIASGTAPPLFSQAGSIDFPEAHFHRRYEVQVMPKPSIANANGYSLRSAINIKWLQ